MSFPSKNIYDTSEEWPIENSLEFASPEEAQKGLLLFQAYIDEITRLQQELAEVTHKYLETLIVRVWER